VYPSEDRGEFNGPYKNLHVYLLQGVVTRADETGLGKHFLGTWLEGETSFLFFTVPSREKINELLHCKGGRFSLFSKNMTSLTKSGREPAWSLSKSIPF